MLKSCFRAFVFGLTLTLVSGSAGAAVLVSDDFSADSGRWTYVGTATRDPNGYVVLTDSVGWSLGQIWLDAATTTPFTASFRYLSGGSDWYEPADGLVLMFYKNKQYVPDMGGWLGFSEYPVNGPSYVPGYGIEVDNYINEWDPAGAHIGLIRDCANDHLAYALDGRAADGLWHTIDVSVRASSVSVSVDGAVVFSWSGPMDRSFSAIGLSGATAAAWAHHFVDDVRIVEDDFVSIAFAVEKNPISASAAVVPAAILGSATFDVHTVDAASVQLQGLAVKDASNIARYEDVNGDGVTDLLLHFDNSARTLPVREYQAALSGKLVDGTPIFGLAPLVVVP